MEKTRFCLYLVRPKTSVDFMLDRIGDQKTTDIFVVRNWMSDNLISID